MQSRIHEFLVRSPSAFLHLRLLSPPPLPPSSSLFFSSRPSVSCPSASLTIPYASLSEGPSKSSCLPTPSGPPPLGKPTRVRLQAPSGSSRCSFRLRNLYSAFISTRFGIVYLSSSTLDSFDSSIIAKRCQERGKPLQERRTSLVTPGSDNSDRRVVYNPVERSPGASPPR